MLQKENNNNNKQNEQRKKKKLYNPFQNDQDYYSVDEKLPIQIKSKIAHWVPRKNSDIFEVRKVLANKKEEIRNINRSLGVYMQDNKILISKKILEEEAKKNNEKIRTNLRLRIMKEEKSKRGFNKDNEKQSNNKEKNYVKKSNYNFNNIHKQRNESIKEEEITESNLNNLDENDFDSISKPKNKERFKNKSSQALPLSHKSLNTVDKIDFRKDKANINLKTKLISAADYDYAITLKNEKSNYKKEKETEKNEEHDNYDTHKANASVLITSLILGSSAKIDAALHKQNKNEYKRKFETSVLQELKEEKYENEKSENKKNFFAAKK